MAKHNSTSLATRFATVAALLAILTMVAITGSSWWMINRQNEVSIHSLLEKDVELQTARISGVLRGINARMSDLPSNPLIKNSLFDPTDKERYLIPFLNGIQQVSDMPIDILFTDFEGREIARNSNKNFSEQELNWLREKFPSGQNTSRIQLGEMGEELLAVNFIVISKSVEGALLYRIKLGDLPLTGSAQIAHGKESKLLLLLPHESVAALADIPPVYKHLNLTISISPHDSDGIEIDWWSVWVFFILGVGVVVIVIIMGLYLGRKLTKDLLKLEFFARRITEKGFGEGSSLEGSSLEGSSLEGSSLEVASLTQSINRMLENLKQEHTKEKEASQYARNMASIVESSHDAITGVTLEDVFTSWNPGAERMYGYLAEEMIGQHVSLIAPPEKMQEAADNLSKNRDGYAVEPYETLRIRKDGSSISVSLTLSPIYDENGVVIGQAGSARDITMQKQASQNARNLASIIESSNDAITSVSLEDIFTSWNAAAERMYGYLAEEMIGQPISLIAPPEKMQESADNLSKILDGYKIEPYETLRIKKDGSTIPILLTASPIYDENGLVIGASSISRDITREKEIIRQLEEMNELRNEFVATIAHDLRAPMASISGFAHMLVDEWSATDDGKKVEYLRIIARNTDTLAEFVEDVLHVARIEAGEFSYNIRSFDIHALAQRALDEATGPNDDRRLELITLGDIPLVLGDEARQWQVFTNLLSNALKFSPAQEPITIELSSIEGSVRVAVIDRGIGIAKDDLPKLFHKSERLLKSGNPIIPGNGLGLFICKTLVEAQGGRIWCESTPGAGSTFFFTIPIA